MKKSLWLGFLVLLAACGSSTSETGADGDKTSTSGKSTANEDQTVRLITHDSFDMDPQVWETFTDESGITVEVIKGGDAGELVSKSILTKDNPEADVLFGIDNSFLQRGLDNELFVSYESPTLADVPQTLQLDAEQNRVTPIDFGDVCVNYWKDALPEGKAPQSLEDLAKPAFASTFVTQNPETSSPGFAFLLATISHFGEDGWQDYWKNLKTNGVEVSTGWEDAYYGEFLAGGEGDKALVTSYASSPAAEVLFAEEPLTQAPTGVLDDTCFRQIEFAGILQGTEKTEAAQQLVDFMLSEPFQQEIPLKMFVSPANSKATIPAEFSDHAVSIDEPLVLDPETIEANRDKWTQQWNEIVFQ